MIVFDTNVLPELMRPTPSEAVLRWFAGRSAATLFTTTITQAEILFGLALLPEGRRRNDLLTAAEQMFAEDFADRVLPFDSMAAKAFAPIAASRGGALATRDVADFLDCGVPIVNPWEG